MPLRRHEVTRLEGFSDAVFGFALTLLVVSLEVPNNFGELLQNMKGLPGFALTFAMICWLWYEHSVFFRSYGLQDRLTVFLNCLLLFVVLFYVYPLKFLAAALMLWFFGIGRETGPAFGARTDGAGLMILYSSGIVLIFFVFAMLYLRAWRQRASLDLTEKEKVSLQYGLRAHLISMSLGIVSLAIVFIMPNAAAIAGMLYGLMGPLHAWNGFQAGKAHSLLDKRLEAS